MRSRPLVSARQANPTQSSPAFVVPCRLLHVIGTLSLFHGNLAGSGRPVGRSQDHRHRELTHPSQRRGRRASPPALLGPSFHHTVTSGGAFAPLANPPTAMSNFP